VRKTALRSLTAGNPHALWPCLPTCGGNQRVTRERRNDPQTIDRGRPRGCLCRRLELANAAQTETCRTIEIKAEAGHTAKATDKANADLRKQAKEMKSTVTRSTINCLPKGKDVVCRLTATVCRK
jgi:hypothetical protein